ELHASLLNSIREAGINLSEPKAGSKPLRNSKPIGVVNSHRRHLSDPAEILAKVNTDQIREQVYESEQKPQAASFSRSPTEQMKRDCFVKYAAERNNASSSTAQPIDPVAEMGMG